MKATAASAVPTGDTLHGFLAALGAALIWAIFPFQFRMFTGIPLLELIAHRAVWTAAVLGLLFLQKDARRAIMEVMRRRDRLVTLCGTCALITTNWLVYTYAVTNGRVMDASLGYFMAPLTAVACGVLLFRERLRPLQGLAIATALLAVGLYAWHLGSLPVISLFLAVSFALYGALRKRLPVGPLVGLLLETLLMLPLAFAYLAWLGAKDGMVLPTGDWVVDLLVVLTGVGTAAALGLFNTGAKGLTYVTVGMMLYIAPSLMFFEAVFLFDEPLDLARLFAFCGIWLALAFYTTDSVLRTRSKAV